MAMRMLRSVVEARHSLCFALNAMGHGFIAQCEVRCHERARLWFVLAPLLGDSLA